MTPNRLIGGEKKESSESASVSEPHPSTSEFTEITADIFMDGDLSSDNLPPPHSSPLLFYAIQHQPSLTSGTLLQSNVNVFKKLVKVCLVVLGSMCCSTIKWIPNDLKEHTVTALLFIMALKIQ
ncbi:hypothetical protein E2C01_048195 [Portunus trituberculatus]|uniref:Uncharacterized protein n=1 Tax=Portunus trituberculatus TaxID=210409 RepID=A0A5B7GA29_PORTR|nr:hypothetical protein [Portunus trituberculatus]